MDIKKEESIYYFFNEEELKVLTEALDSWKNRKMSGKLIGGLMAAMMSDKLPEEEKLKLEQELKKKEEEDELQRENDSETATLIKSKLIMLKRAIQQR